MIKVYWKSPFRQKASILLIAITSLFLYVIVELFQIDKEQPHYKEKLIAAKLAEKAFNQLSEKDFDKIANEESNSIAVIIQHMAGNMISIRRNSPMSSRALQLTWMRTRVLRFMPLFKTMIRRSRACCWMPVPT